MLRRSTVISWLLVIPFAGFPAASTAGPSKPHAMVIPLESAGQVEVPILTGPPETVTMRSGLIALTPGKSVGRHVTEHREELLIVLEGKGEMSFGDGSAIPVESGHAVYCPPETEHDVTNTGSTVLRYVYVVARVPDPGPAHP